MNEGTRPELPPATVRRSRFSLIWLVPLIALAIAAYIGIRTVRSEGPLIDITFKTGDGLVAGQTKVRHKAVELGQVEGVHLTDDLQNVVVSIRMRQEAVPYLTDMARFWVVRPRLNSGSISGIETLVSGSYIEMDPGGREGHAATRFTGLENPPGVRSGEPGKTYQIKANRLGSLGSGSPVFWRDINVGEVIGYDIGNGDGPVTVNVFVRSPYDGFVRDGSHFWNVSGLSVNLGAGGVHVEVASLQAVLSGGVAFDTPHQPDAKPIEDGAEFPLFRDYAEAQAAGFKTRQVFETFFDSDVSGLAANDAVQFLGQQIGTVSEVALDFDPATTRARVRVKFEIQPERIKGDSDHSNPVDIAKRLVERGLRAQLQTSSYLTGQKVLSMAVLPNAPAAEMVKDGDVYVIPSTGGGLDNILAAASDVANKISRLPLDEIGTNLNATLRSASGALGGVQELTRKADSGLSPVLQRLPAVITSIQEAVTQATRTFGSLGAGYGKESQFSRELDRAMSQVGDTARSIRLLADYLDRHPEALIRGRADYGQTR